MTKPSPSMLKIFIGTGATVLVLLIALWVSYQRFAGLSSASGWSVRSYQILLETNRMLTSLANIQIGARDFALSGNNDAFEMFDEGRRDFSKRFKTTQVLLGDNPKQQKRMGLLKRQYLIWMRGHIEPMLRMRRANIDAVTVMRRLEKTAPRRRIVVATLRRTISQIEARELDRLNERRSGQQLQENLAKSALFLNGIFAVVLAAGLSVVLASNTRKLEVSNQRLTEQMAKREIGERKAEILSSHNELILEATADGIMGVNQAGKMTFFNPAAEILTGFSATEAIGRSEHDLLHRWREDGSPYPVAECSITATLKDGKPRVATEVFWHKNNTPVPVEFTCSPMMMSNEEEGLEDRQVGAVVVFRDISARLRSQAKFHEMASLVEHAEDAIIVVNLQGAITGWNDGATKLYGYTTAEMLGLFTDKLVPAELTNELPALIQRIKRDEPVERYEALRFCKDGRRIRVAVALSPVKSGAGEVVAVASIAQQVIPPHFTSTV